MSWLDSPKGKATKTLGLQQNNIFYYTKRSYISYIYIQKKNIINIQKKPHTTKCVLSLT
jgi:hypothetical protein